MLMGSDEHASRLQFRLDAADSIGANGEAA